MSRDAGGEPGVWWGSAGMRGRGSAWRSKSCAPAGPPEPTERPKRMEATDLTGALVRSGRYAAKTQESATNRRRCHAFWSTSARFHAFWSLSERFRAFWRLTRSSTMQRATHPLLVAPFRHVARPRRRAPRAPTTGAACPCSQSRPPSTPPTGSSPPDAPARSPAPCAPSSSRRCAACRAHSWRRSGGSGRRSR